MKNAMQGYSRSMALTSCLSMIIGQHRSIHTSTDPEHAKALKTAGLALDIFPTLGEILDNQQMDPTINDDKGKKNNQDTRTVPFGLGMSKWWNNPAHAMLKELWSKHGLTWL
jgi:hypothetical protein